MPEKPISSRERNVLPGARGRIPYLLRMAFVAAGAGAEGRVTLMGAQQRWHCRVGRDGRLAQRLSRKHRVQA